MTDPSTTSAGGAAVASADLDRGLAAYRQMVLIRRFEEAAQALHQAGAIRGSQHQCIGQEATSVGVCQALHEDDVIFITYRGHGQALAKGMPPLALMAELLGRSIGCCGGYGGSMHLTDVEHGVMVGNAIVAAGLPMAVGAALTFQLERSRRVAVAFFGDGATNQGTFHEALNLASLWKAPVLFACENNLYSEMTPLAETTVVTDLVRRAAAVGVPGEAVDGNDVGSSSRPPHGRSRR
jgi:TPP-dependent pyruvate/acetoin dehydrogenase alpha subunit